jgi:flavin-dependent dehydrogenase
MAHPLTSAFDVLVIGAGPAGSAAAALLHKAGHSVQVVEAQRFPRFVIGESLLPHCMDILDEADLLEPVRARGFQVKNGALFFRGKERTSFSFEEQYTDGWGWTWQVPRAEFDSALADSVIARGVPVHFAHKVESACFDGEPEVVVADDAGTKHTVRPKFVVDASGYGRVLPKLLGLDRPSPFPERMALFTHVTGEARPAGPDSGRIWVCIHPGTSDTPGGIAWIWMIPFSDGKTSVGAVSSPAFFESFQGSPEEKLRAILSMDETTTERFSGATFMFEPRELQGYAASVSAVSGKGYCLVGNATEFLDPIFSSGVTLALESSSRAAKCIDKQLRGQAVDWQANYAEPMAKGIDVFRTFVARWYDGTLQEVLFASEQAPEIRAQVCSVLAGYVWDESNPIVKHHARRIPQLVRILRSRQTEVFSSLQES